ncbi:hypothetical protein QA599_21050 [Haloarculaceae archaeon H-GB1-1]|nr:hypothetical protein [Haloarculaceae archaeon H-GB1-1]
MTPSACQIASPGDTACPLPWDCDRRADAKADLFRFVAGTPEGANLPYIVRTVFGRDTDLAGADAQLARRFFADHPELFETTRRDGYLWVDPTPVALHLNRRKQRAKNEDGDGFGADVPDDRPDWAKDRARAALSKWSTVGSDSTRADFLQELATERESIDDVWNVFERVRGSGPEYLCVPYRTRFNSTDRARGLRASWERAWDRASERYDDAVVVTLTTDPGMHESIASATDALIENKNRLAGWLAYNPKSPDRPSRPGYRPPNLYVLEFTDSGLPHLHVVFFGVPWVTTQAALSTYWERREQGRVVDVRRLSNRRGRWRWSGDRPDDAAGQTPRDYLSKSIRALSTVADMTPGDLFDAAAARRSGDPIDALADLWKIALYWATGKRFFDGSGELTKDDNDADSVPHVPRYRFVGAAQYNDLPGYVRSRAAFLTRRDFRDRPPPSMGTGTRNKNVSTTADPVA